MVNFKPQLPPQSAGGQPVNGLPKPDLPPDQPMPTGYLPGFPLAPQPKTLTLLTRPMLALYKGRPQTGDLLSEEAGALIGGVVAAVGQLDHFLRRAYDLKFFQGTIRYELQKLINRIEAVVVMFAKDYDSATGDTANKMGAVLGQSAELLLRLSPRQVQSALKHQHTMVEQNIDYVPLPVAARGLLPTTDGWLLVAVESPYASNDPQQVERNLRYLRACLRDCLSRRETPLAAHGLLTQPGVVNPLDEAEMELSAEAGIAWTQYAQRTVVYTDLGQTRAMKEAVARAQHEGREVEFRTLGQWEPAPEEGEAVELSPQDLEAQDGA